MIIYGLSISPFVRKVLAFAAEKGVAVDSVALGGGSQDPGFLAASPFRKVPALRDGDFLLSDSSAIIAYLDALQPQPNLIPVEARARARAIWFEEFADTLFYEAHSPVFYNRLVAPCFLNQPGDAAAADAAERERLSPILAYLDGQIPASGYLVEDRLTLADLAVASLLAGCRHVAVDISPWPRVGAYADRILARPSFAPLIAQERAMLLARGQGDPGRRG